MSDVTYYLKNTEKDGRLVYARRHTGGILYMTAANFGDAQPPRELVLQAHGLIVDVEDPKVAARKAAQAAAAAKRLERARALVAAADAKAAAPAPTTKKKLK